MISTLSAGDLFEVRRQTVDSKPRFHIFSETFNEN